MNTYNQNDHKIKNIFPQNFAYNKPKKSNIFGNPYSMITQKGYIKNTLNTETGEAKEYDSKSYVLSNCDNSSVCTSSVKVFNICNSPKVIRINKDNKINKNINNSSTSNIHSNNNMKISQKKDNKNYGLNTYTTCCSSRNSTPTRPSPPSTGTARSRASTSSASPSC